MSPRKLFIAIITLVAISVVAFKANPIGILGFLINFFYIGIIPFVIVILYVTLSGRKSPTVLNTQPVVADPNKQNFLFYRGILLASFLVWPGAIMLVGLGGNSLGSHPDSLFEMTYPYVKKATLYSLPFALLCLTTASLLSQKGKNLAATRIVKIPFIYAAVVATTFIISNVTTSYF